MVKIIIKCDEVKWDEGRLNGVWREGFKRVVKWSEVKVLVKCVYRLLKL